MIDTIKNFFIEEDLENILGWLGINYKKAQKNRVILSVFFCILTICIGIYTKIYYLILLGFLIGFAVYKYQYFSVKKRKKKIIALKKRMFPSFVKKMLILIRTNNIYNAFIKMIDYTDDPIRGYLIELVEEIKEDKTIKPYNNFAQKMEFIEAYQIMAMLYTFSEHAMNKKHLISLETMISHLYDNEIDEMIESKKRALWLYPNFTILTMLAIVFALAIYMFISIMGSVSL